MEPCRRSATSGVTLIELLVGLALAAVLVALGLPVYADWIADYQVLNHAEKLAGTMNIARSEALKRGRPVDVAQLADGSLIVSDDLVGALYRISYDGK